MLAARLVDRFRRTMLWRCLELVSGIFAWEYLFCVGQGLIRKFLGDSMETPSLKMDERLVMEYDAVRVWVAVCSFT